jgi:hypothetical protein
MPKVIKISIFLFTYTTTILGLLPWQDPVPACAGYPAFPPIATEGKVFNNTSHVNGITAAMQTHLQTLRHPSCQFLYLARPNLDPPGALTPSLNQRIPNPLNIISNPFDWGHPTTISRHEINSTSTCSQLNLSQRWSSSPGEVILGLPPKPLFKFKNKTNDIEFTVNPLPTCSLIKDSLNLPFGEFLLSQFQSSQLQLMQRQIATFSSPTKEVAVKTQTKPPTKSMVRQFNHDPKLLAAHREDRIFRSKYVWIQGLPTDPDQAMEIVQHAAKEVKLPIPQESIATLGEHFTALNSKDSGGPSIPSMIGSTSSSYAAIVALSSQVTFSAVPIMGNVPTVTELVVRTTNSNKDMVTTIVIVPWIVEATSDLQIVLRLHHMVMDAKSELVHAVYHQLATLSTTHATTQIQFIARIIAAPKPIWVIDFLAPIGYSAVHINSHFFSNSAGSSAVIEFDGIPTQMVGGYGISGAALPGFSSPALSWANLPVSKNLPLRYLADMMDRMGCEPTGTISILYAKAEPLRTGKNRQDRQALNQKANSTEAPTFIFRNPTYLKYFLDHVRFFLQDKIPPFLIGHSIELPSGSTTASYSEDPITIAAFMKEKSFTRYLSNAQGDGHKTLEQPNTDQSQHKMDYIASAGKLLATAKKDMPLEQFTTSVLHLLTTLLPDLDISASLGRMQLGSRHSSPKRKLGVDVGTSRSIHLRRSLPAADLNDTQTDLTYSYEPMDEDDSSVKS